MKKSLILCLWLLIVFTMAAHAVTDDFAPHPPSKKAEAKPVYTISNIYFAYSTDRGQAYSDLTKITDFISYGLDGKWLMGVPSQIAIKPDGNPVVAFDGGNDFNGYSHTWFWSAATGLVVVDSSTSMHVWSSVAVADNGDIYVSWGDYYGGFYPGWENTTAGDIFIARSTDNGASWGAKVNVSNYIQALNPNDSCQTYPKLARRAISGVHLLWADDSKSPGSFIQGIGVADSVFLRYAKVNLDLSGLDVTVGVNDMGWTAYDWAITGNTQGIAIDSIEQAACAWTYGPIASPGGALRNIGYNYYIPGSGAGTMVNNLAPQRAGFPGIDVSNVNGAVCVAYHSLLDGVLVGAAIVDTGGVGTGLWTTQDTVLLSAYAWPSVTFVGSAIDAGGNPSDSVAFCGGNIADVNYTFLPAWTSPLISVIIGGFPRFEGSGTYAAIGASKLGIYGVFYADSVVYPPSYDAPTLNLTVGAPTADSITLWWLRSSTDATVDSFFLLRRVGEAGSWAQFMAMDTVALAGQDTGRCSDGWTLPYSPVDTFYYVLLAKSPWSYSNTSNMVWVIVGDSILGIKGTPIAFNGGKLSLNQNRPNPVSRNTEFSFNLPRAGRYSITIYNVTGQITNVLKGQGNPGMNKISWNGCDKNGRKVPNGVYLYTLKALDKSATKRLVVVK
jgi:hypothetical protein